MKYYKVFAKMGLTYNDKKYLYLMNPHSFKSHSLEDNVYFTTRDVIMNADSSSDIVGEIPTIDFTFFNIFYVLKIGVLHLFTFQTPI